MGEGRRVADPVPLSVEVMLFGFGLIGLGPFAAGGMLLWGLVALLPILLHLLRRRRSRTVQWGAMQFLQAAIARRAQQFQFWRLLLLCLRIAAVLVIAAALARPMLEAAISEADAGRSPPRLRVLVLDTSYSMQTLVATGEEAGGPTDGGNRSRFQAAQEAAAEVCRSSAAGDGFLLLTMSDPPQTIIHSVSERADQTRSEIQRLSAGEGRADLPATLAAVEAAIRDAVQNGWTGPIDVLVFSDLQQSTWQSLPASPPRRPSSEDAAAAPIRYLVWDAGEPLVGDNATVGPVQRDSSAAGADGSSIWLSPVTHNGGQAIRGRLAQLLVDGHVEQSQLFDLEPGGSRTLLWSTQLSPGRHGLEVRIGDDALALDNQTRSIAEVSPKISVAAFGPTIADTRYLALAAAPGGEGPLEVRSFSLNRLPQTELGRFDIWVLCNPSPLRDSASERIRQHLGQGGGVVWWLGPNWRSGQGADAVTTRAETGSPESARAGRWTARETREVETPNIDPLGYRIGFVQPFEAFPGSGLLSLPVFRYWILELGSRWQPAVAIGDGDPLIASYAAEGEGRQVLVATPPGPGSPGAGSQGPGSPGPGSPGRAGEAASESTASSDPWNALIAWPSFVPLVQEIIRWAEAGTQGSTHFLVGQPITGQSPEAEFASQLRNAADDTLEVQVQTRSGNSVQWTAGMATSAGFYKWSEDRPATDPGSVEAPSADAGQEARSGGAPVIAVNVDPEEGRLEKIAELAPPWMPFRESVPAAAAAAGNEPAASESAAVGGRELFWWFLLAALGLLTAESLVVKILEGRF